MINNPKISVIVSIYNVENYLQRCIDSILAQTFTAFELLLVNDGSTDNSGEICNKYAKEDSRIRLFHKENGGVSSARNLGLVNAKGEYVAFIDGDDWTEKDYLSVLYNYAVSQNADIVACDFVLEQSQSECVYMRQPYDNNKERIIQKLLNNELGGYLWNKLIKRKIFVDNGISFPNDIVIWEDLLVSVSLYCCSAHFAYVSKPLYHYVHYNTSSATYSINGKKVAQKIRVCELLELILSKQKLLEKCISELRKRQLIAKMEYATDFRLKDFKKWNDVFQSAYIEAWNLSYPRWMKIQMWFVRKNFYQMAYFVLWIKKLIKR